MIKQLNYRAGSIIKYRNSGGEVRRVTVESKEDDIKNGRPGFDGQVRVGEWCWGYDDQIVEVVQF
jgi:hypothetical protein